MQDTDAMLAGASPCAQVRQEPALHPWQEPGSVVAGFFICVIIPFFVLLFPLLVRGGVTDTRVRERFHKGGSLMPECGNKLAGVLALNLSRRDRNRADLSSDMYR
jgi:hypothetical protein